MIKKLNVGCGKDIREGWTNLDSVNLPGVDVHHDIAKLPLPFMNSEFDEILCKDVLEHVEYITILGDLHRILKPGGELTIRVPHFTSKDAFSDPTHRKFFTSRTFLYFTTEHLRSYYTEFSFSSVKKIYIYFDKRLMYPYNYLLEPLININTRFMNFYEGSPLRVFPATNIEIVLVK